MKKEVLLLIVILIIPFSSAQRINQPCPDYCSDSIYNYNGVYNERTRECEYKTEICEFGCAGRTECAGEPEEEIIELDCYDYCEDRIHYFSGVYNSANEECEYETRNCKYSCEGDSCKVPEDTDCDDYCSDSIYHKGGSYNEWTQECDYDYAITCENGCGEEGTGCKEDNELPQTNKDEQIDYENNNNERAKDSNRIEDRVRRGKTQNTLSTNKRYISKSRKGKLLGMFSIRIPSLEVYDENKNKIEERTPWWEGLVFSIEEKEEVVGGCGNGICLWPENPIECPHDCGNCGDGICNWNEMGQGSCPQDCKSACGNQVCEPDEATTDFVCTIDCGYCGDDFCGTNELHNCINDCPPTCGNDICELREIYELEYECAYDCVPGCGNNICEGGENPENCPGDCTYCGDKICANTNEMGKEGGLCPFDCLTDCGNGVCEGGENPENCALDCGWCGDGVCGWHEIGEECYDCGECGNAVCDSNEDYDSCFVDCNYCGDGICSKNENNLTCTEDCLHICGDGICSKNENCAADCLKTCGDGICSEKESLKSCPEDCKSPCGNWKCEKDDFAVTCALDCKSNCGDGLCNGVESDYSCPKDCRVVQTTTVEYVNNDYYDDYKNLEGSCGNGICEEDNTICSQDCGYCGDGICSENEKIKCPFDCLNCGDKICSEDEIGICIECEEKEMMIKPKCGNKIVDGEVCINCEWDCGYCGDGICSPIEKGKCDWDCKSPCGNEICEIAEDTNNCPFDCAS